MTMHMAAVLVPTGPLSRKKSGKPNRKCGGKVQAQSGEKRAGHSTAGAGDAEKEAERTAGKPGQQMVGKDDRA